MIAMALGCLVQDLLSRRSAASAAPVAPTVPAMPLVGPDAVTGGERNVKKTYQLTALTAAYILLLRPLGYPICIALFLVVAIRIFGYRRWLPTVLMAALIAAASYVAYVHWLKVPLPMGFLEDLLD
jgi:hypothetical protein